MVLDLHGAFGSIRTGVQSQTCGSFRGFAHLADLHGMQERHNPANFAYNDAGLQIGLDT